MFGLEASEPLWVILNVPSGSLTRSTLFPEMSVPPAVKAPVKMMLSSDDVADVLTMEMCSVPVAADASTSIQ